jgi:hypothetical protein
LVIGALVVLVHAKEAGSRRVNPLVAMQRNGIRLQQAGKKIGQSVTPRAAMMTARMRGHLIRPSAFI